MGKKILAILGGIVGATVVILILEYLGHKIYSPAENTDLSNPEVLKQFMNNLPLGAFLSVLLAYAIGSLAGGIITSLIQKPSKTVNAIIVGIVIMLFGISNMMMIPHPMWFWIVSFFVYIPFSYLGSKIIK